MLRWIDVFEQFLLSLKTISELFTWPIVVLILGFSFRRALESLLPRLSKIGPTGAEFIEQHSSETLNKDALGQAKGATDPQVNFEDLPLVDPVAIEVEATHQKTLAEIPDQRKEKVLVRALTNAQMEKLFALAYANIFGSQIRALEALNSGGVSKKDAQEFFADFQSREPVHKERSLDEFMQYLINWRYVAETESGYEITETGRNFLRYLINAKLSKERMY